MRCQVQWKLPYGPVCLPILGLILLLSAPLLADTDDWNDLDYDPGAIYGSEKEEKFRINAFIVEEENWDDHYSLSIFGAFRYTDYPLFTEWNIGYLYQNLQSKNDPRHRQYLFPFYYYKTNGNASLILTPLAWFSDHSDGYRNSYAHLIYTGGNANEFSLLALPLLYYNSNRQERYNLTVVPLFSLHHGNRDALSLITPLAYYNRKPQAGKSTLILPGYYHHSHVGRNKTVSQSLVLNFWHSYDDSSELRRLYALPLYFGTFGRDYSTHFLPAPLIYQHTGENQNRTLVFNTWYSSDGEHDSNFHFMPLYFSGTAEQSAWHAGPLFYYAHFVPRRAQIEAQHNGTTPIESTRALVLNAWYSSDGEHDSTFHFMPLYFSGTAEQSAWHAGPLFYYAHFVHRRAQIEAQHNGTTPVKSTRALVLNTWYSSDGEHDSNFHFMPLYFSGSAEQSAWHAGPLFYYAHFVPRRAQIEAQHNGTTPIESTRALVLNAWYSSDGEHDSNFHILPYYFSSTSENSGWHYGHIFYYSYENTPNVNAGESPWKAQRFRFVSPVAYAHNQESTAQNEDGSRSYSKNTLHINPFFYYSDSIESTGLEQEYATTVWAPIVPLYYRHRAPGVQQDFIINTYRSKRDDQLEMVWSVPFYYYRPGPDGYLHIVPFYFNPHREPENFTAFSPLHYLHDDPTGRTFWLANYFSHANYTKETDYTVNAPFYLSWDTPAHSGDLVFPLYFNYTDDSLNYHINVAGYSRSRERLPAISSSSDETGKRWHLDQDFALLYNLVSVSTRLTAGEAELNELAEFTGFLSAGSEAKSDSDADANAEIAINTDAESDETKESDGDMESVLDVQPETFSEPDWIDPTNDTAHTDDPAVSRDRTISRENSDQFFGLSLFYGLTAYEMADTRRHFRMLPLSWFSWDTASDDRAFFVPGAFLSYNRPELEYFAIFPAFVPLYGRQRDGDSLLESYLAIGYLYEHDESEARTEHSVLWPLIHTYDSPEFSSMRALPLFYQREYKEPAADEIASLTVSPVYYSQGTSRGSFHDLLLLAFWYTQDDQLEGGAVLPLWFYKRDAFHHVAPLYFSFQTVDNSIYAGPLYYYSERRDFTGSTLILPGYYASRNNDKRHHNVLALFDYYTDTNESAYWFFPLIHYGNNPAAQSAWVAPFYYRSNHDGSDTRWTFLPLVYNRTYKNHDGQLAGVNFTPLHYYASDPDSTFLATPLGFYNRNQDRTTLFLPGYYGNTEPDESHHNVLALFDARVGATESTYWFFPLMRYSEDQVATSTFVAPFYYRSKHDGSNTRWSVIPLVYNRVAHYQDGTDAYLNFSPLHYYNTNSDRSLLITPLAYYHRDLESDTLFFPGYYAHNNAREQSRLYGNVWRRTAYDSTNKSLHVLPLYLSWHADNYDEYFISGLYLYKNQNRSHQNFLMLADHEYDRESERRSVSLALGALHYDSRPGSVSTGIGILEQPVLAGLDVAADGYDFNLLWHKQVSDAHSYHNSFFPLWWVDVSSDETFWVAAPLLSYSEVYGNSGTHLWGAGAIYYSSYDLDYGERSTHMLMGLLYQDIQKPERGYRTRGSLWRILWEYQEESDTGFQKFSILKFVYSRTKTEEEIHHRVLGVKIS